MRKPSARGLITAAVSVGIAAASVPGPASAATRYDFAYGGGRQARMWLSSQWNPGTCTINVDYNQSKKYPELNKVDSVVLSPSALGLSGKTVPITWGATALNPTGSQLLVRFVDLDPPGCPNTVVAVAGPGTKNITVPTGNILMVVTATEGTVQPWFRI